MIINNPNESKSYIEIVTNSNSNGIIIFVIIFLIMSTACMVYLSILARRKVYKIMDPDVNESFCILSVYTVKSVILCMIYGIIMNLLIVIFIMMGPSFQSTMKNNKFPKLVMYCYHALYSVPLDLVYFFQIYEWVTMLYIL